jgi:ABC-2 type transport system permease protein
MTAMFKREFAAYFTSPVASIVIALFMFLSSLFFNSKVFNQVAEFNSNLYTMGILFLFFVPILTMRIIAEDRKNGTVTLLYTTPKSLTGIVMGKFLAILCVFVIMTMITMLQPMVLFLFGNPPIAQIIGGYIGFLLMGAALISIGLFTSSLTENQIIAAIISLIINLCIWMLNFIMGFTSGIFTKILAWFSLFSRYEEFSKGLFNVSHLIYYLSFTGVFIFFTIRVIEKRRWSQG